MNIENDPRLTAYALGELVESERQIFEQELANAGGAEVALREIRECICRIQEAFASEPAYAMTAEQRAVLLAEAAVEPAVALPVGEEIQHSDKILPWVTQPVISEVDKRKIAEALRPSPLGRLVPLLGSLGVAAGLVWLAAVVMTYEWPATFGDEEVASEGDLPPVSIHHPERPFSWDGWLDRRAGDRFAGGVYPYRYGLPSPVPPEAVAGVPGFANPAFEGRRVSEFPVSMGIRSYEALRKCMLAGLLPPTDEVEIGQILNAFEYEFAQPSLGETFAVETELADCPWAPDRQLLQIGVTAADSSGGEPVAEDVHMAVEFNPDTVAGYRLIGEEPGSEEGVIAARQPAEVRGGQTVTALYEVIPQQDSAAGDAEVATVRVDYNSGGAGTAQSLETPVADVGETPWRDASDDFRFAASVAGYGMLLGNDGERPLATYELVLELARDAVGEDRDGKRAEFVEWVEKTIEMKSAED